MELRKGPVCPLSKSGVGTLFVSTPIGLFEIKVCEEGIHQLGLSGLTKENFNPVEDSTEVRVDKGMSTVFVEDDDEDDEPKAKRARNNAAGAVLQWMKMYFAKPEKITADLPPICLPPAESTTFERDVWNTLANTTLFGKTVTYAGLAVLIGNPKASRAVGTALKKNPIGVVVPCHRVVRSDGTIGNYAGGRLNAVKKWLLDFEKRHSGDSGQ